MDTVVILRVNFIWEDFIKIKKFSIFLVKTWKDPKGALILVKKWNKAKKFLKITGNDHEEFENFVHFEILVAIDSAVESPVFNEEGDGEGDAEVDNGGDKAEEAFTIEHKDDDSSDEIDCVKNV